MLGGLARGAGRCLACQAPDHEVAIDNKTQGDDSYTKKGRQGRGPEGYVGGKVRKGSANFVVGRKYSDVRDGEANVTDGKVEEDGESLGNVGVQAKGKRWEVRTVISLESNRHERGRRNAPPTTGSVELLRRAHRSTR